MWTFTGLPSYLKNELSKKGLIVLDNNSNNWPQEAKLNHCLIGRWYPSHSEGGSIPNSAKGGYVVKNCKNEIVYENYSLASHVGYYYDKNTPLSVEKAFKPIRSFKYRFNESLTPKIQYPTLEVTTETEESLKKYLDNNKLNPIEGIYKSLQNAQGFYKFGVIKSGEKFKVIIIESNLPQWKSGEVKAYCEPSSMKGFYSVKWFLANKTSTETFAKMEDDAILSIEYTNQENNQKRQDKFIKMYPASTGEFSSKSDKSKASGSGFFYFHNWYSGNKWLTRFSFTISCLKLNTFGSLGSTIARTQCVSG